MSTADIERERKGFEQYMSMIGRSLGNREGIGYYDDAVDARWRTWLERSDRALSSAGTPQDPLRSVEQAAGASSMSTEDMKAELDALKSRLFDALHSDALLSTALEDVDHAVHLNRGTYSRVLDVACVQKGRIAELEAQLAAIPPAPAGDAAEARAWLIEWEPGDGKTWVAVHANELTALDHKARTGNGRCTALYPAAPAAPARPVTAEEDAVLRGAAMRSAKVIPHPDSLRLDFLEQNQGEGLHPCFHEEREPKTTTEGGYWKRAVFDGWSVGTREPVMGVREAIDEARLPHTPTPHIPVNPAVSDGSGQ